MSPWATARSRLLLRRGLPIQPVPSCLGVRYSSEKATSPRKTWSDTLLLPKTAFPMKHKHPEKEELKWRERATSELYKWQWENNEGPVFVLHDGPPYANGDIHMGHALNKVLKDFINRYKTSRGYRVKYIPGWDCHGLPIEHKSLKALGKSHLQLSPQAIREAARKTANEAIDIQREQFRALGIMADWESPEGSYTTMDQRFEIRQLRLLQKMVEKGLLQHRDRPTYYSPSSRTALAEAELKYQDDFKSQSVYVYFPVRAEDMSAGLKQAWEKVGEGRDVGLAVWTTTAWTLAANQAVAIGSDMEYAIVEPKDGKRLLVIAMDRLEPLQEILEILGELTVLAKFSGSDLLGTQYEHTFWNSDSPKPKIIPSRHVTSSAGTGLVHTAPGHGQEDYEAFRAALGAEADSTKIRCPVDDAGDLTADLLEWVQDEAVAERLVGKNVLGSAVPEMVKILEEQGTLLKAVMIKHRYPTDWKTKEPIIVRSTPQWFADVEAVRPDALKALDQIAFKPEQSKRRLESFLQGRSEWCISRQRSWGVPIPVLCEVETGKVHLSSETLDHIIPILAAKGTDFWWSDAVDEFVPPSLKAEGITFRKGFDTMDVWFDSGSSWTLMKEMGLKSATEPIADIYLEGSDQHRGWFQSSLLTWLCSAGEEAARSPYAAVVTHGFVLDQEGKKMSKSAGNGIMPLDVINGTKKQPPLGTDVLRLWAASVEYTKDAHVGPSSLAMAAENARKLRNVIKFLLGNAYRAGEKPKSPEEFTLSLLDKHILDELAELESKVMHDFEELYFARALQNINTFMSGSLSTLYVEETKDILYCDAAQSDRRQAVVAVLAHILDRLTRLLAPITPHLVEEVSHHITGQTAELTALMIHWTDSARQWKNSAVAEKMKPLLELRRNVMILLEQARNAKSLKTGNEAVLAINVKDLKFEGLLKEHREELAQLFGVARVQLEGDSTTPSDSSWSYTQAVDLDFDKSLDVNLTLLPSEKQKCPRCWKHVSEEAETLCGRCEEVVSSLP